MTRPSYNTGTGFYVGADNKLYDPSNQQFVPRGVNRNHYDSGAAAGITKSRATAERFVLYWDNNTTAAEFVTQLYNECYSNGIVAIPSVFTTATAYGHVTVTGSNAASDLTHAVDQWVGQAADWTANYQGIPTERWMIINIANEWGPSNSATWRDSYITAISRMRTAGYKHTLLIDSGGGAQNADDIINYGQAVFDSDPQKNIVFAIHLYGNLTPTPQPPFNGNNLVTGITKANPAVVTVSGNFTNVFTNGMQLIIAQVLGMTQVNSVDQNNIIYKAANVNTTNKTFELHDINDVAVDSTGYSTYTSGGSAGVYGGQAQAASLLQSIVNTGLPIIVGEFGPGRNIGPSPTMTWPGDVIRAAEALNVGWLAWAWDDNDLGGGTSDDFWFAMVYNNAVYNVTADLTTYGQDVVLGYPYSFQVSNYPRANFTYSPGLQVTSSVELGGGGATGGLRGHRRTRKRREAELLSMLPVVFDLLRRNQ